jgi:hypothetical protein
MPVFPVLSAEEVLFLVKIGAGPLAGTKIPPDHRLKLVGLPASDSGYRRLRMPEHFFDVRSSDGTLVSDEAGKALPDIGAAHIVARQCAYKLAVAEYRRTGTVDGRKVEIVDQTGKLLDDVCVRDSII